MKFRDKLLRALLESNIAPLSERIYLEIFKIKIVNGITPLLVSQYKLSFHIRECL